MNLNLYFLLHHQSKKYSFDIENNRPKISSKRRGFIIEIIYDFKSKLWFLLTQLTAWHNRIPRLQIRHLFHLQFVNLEEWRLFLLKHSKLALRKFVTDLVWTSLTSINAKLKDFGLNKLVKSPQLIFKSCSEHLVSTWAFIKFNFCFTKYPRKTEEQGKCQGNFC